MRKLDKTSQETHLFPCENCGADLRFSPTNGVLACDQCGFHEEKATPKTTILELDFQSALADALPLAEIEETRVTSCPNCGAHVGFEGESHASECPFCATPVVLDTGTHRQIKPKGVVPFQVAESKAHDLMSEWLGRRWFAPNGLREYARKGRKMQGIYVPYWTFDADTKSRYSGQRGTEYQTTSSRIENGKKVQRTVTKVRWTAVSGRVSRFFDDVLVLASDALPTHYTQALEPWDLSVLEPFQAYYLAGFRAEGYSIGIEQGFTLAREKMDRQILRDVRFDIGGDRQQVGAVETSVKDITFKHILLPVWLAVYKYRGKTYRFVVNGQTGRIEGERPYSTWKIAFVTLVVLTVAAIFGYFYAQSAQ